MSADEFADDVRSESHNHWAVGYVDGYAIRVYKPLPIGATGAGDDERIITPAFMKWCELQDKLEDYPILDEELYDAEQQEEIDAAWENWLRYDFTKAIEKRFGYDLRDTPSIKGLWELLCEKGNVEWYEESSGMTCRYKIEELSFDDCRPYLDCELTGDELRWLTTILALVEVNPEFHRMCGLASIGTKQFFELKDRIEDLLNLENK